MCSNDDLDHFVDRASFPTLHMAQLPRPVSVGHNSPVTSHQFSKVKTQTQQHVLDIEVLQQLVKRFDDVVDEAEVD
jgi:hypothetical protein